MAGDMSEHAQQFVDLATNPVVNSATGSAGIFIFLAKEIPVIVGVLTAAVLFCQLCAWVYKFHQFLTTKKKKKTNNH
jgi:hypothetical protein